MKCPCCGKNFYGNMCNSCGYHMKILAENKYNLSNKMRNIYGYHINVNRPEEVKGHNCGNEFSTNKSSKCD